MPNRIETFIQKLQSGQAIFLGHSALIANISGLRVAFDLTTTDGKMPSPFSNLAISGSDTIPHLLPLVDTQTQIARPKEIASSLDMVVYSHLHTDHFSLGYIAALKGINPQIRIICPQNTKHYLNNLSNSVMYSRQNIVVRIKGILTRLLFGIYLNGVEDLTSDIRRNSETREELINQIEEISTSFPIRIEKNDSEILLSAFPTTHPAFQLYLKTPYETEPPPPVLGYKITYQDGDYQRSVLFIGEGASDPDTLFHIFQERERLGIAFIPITEQIESHGSQFLQEFAAHSSLRTLALIERIVLKHTVIMPLHQGLWYFNLTPQDIVKARAALEKLGGNKKCHLPFVALSREFLSISNRIQSDKILPANNMYVTKILATLWARWKQYKKLAKIAVNLPIGGRIAGFIPGTVVSFSNVEETTIDDITKETCQASIQAFLTEYQALHQQIDRDWDWQARIINYILLVIGSVVTLFSAFPDQEMLFLAASFILTSLGWMVIEKSVHMLRIGRYFLGELIPRANQLLRCMEKLEVHDPRTEKIKVLLYDGFFRGGNIQTAVLGFAGWERFALSTVPGFAFAVTFLFIKRSTGNVWSPLETALLIFGFILSLLPLFIAILNARFSFSGKQ